MASGLFLRSDWGYWRRWNASPPAHWLSTDNDSSVIKTWQMETSITSPETQWVIPGLHLVHYHRFEASPIQKTLTWFSRELWAPAGRWEVEERSLCSTWLLQHLHTAGQPLEWMEAQFNRLDMPVNSYVTHTVIMSITYFWGFPSARECKGKK